MTVELNPTGSEKFKGFFLQARNSDDDIIGSFETVTNDSKYVNCGNKPQTEDTHVNIYSDRDTNVEIESDVKVEATDQFPCEYCGKVCDSKRDLNNHIRNNHEVKHNICYICGKSFPKSKLLENHMHSVHSTETETIVVKYVLF